MNKKAQKTQIEFPPLFNMAKDRPHIDTTFKNVEKVNGPYLNAMIQPMWVKNTNLKSIYDKQGNEYHIKDSKLYKNGTSILPITDYKFVKTEVTDDLKDVLSYDIYGSSNMSIRKNGSIWLNNTQLELPLPSGFTIVEARVRMRNANSGLAVIYYDVSNSEQVKFLKIENGSITLNIVRAATWYRQSVNWAGQAYSTNMQTVSDVDPCIHMAYVGSNWYVSFTGYTGEVIPYDKTHFMTFVINSNVTQLTAFNVGKPTITVNTQQSDILFLKKSQSRKTSTRTVVTKDYITYYVYNSTATDVRNLTVISDIPAGYSFTSRNMFQNLRETDDGDLIRYSVLQFNEFIDTIKLTVTGSSGRSYRISGVNFNITNPNTDNKSAGNWQTPEGLEGTDIGSASYYNGIYSFRASQSGFSQDSNSVIFQYKFYQGQNAPSYVAYSQAEIICKDYLTASNYLYNTSIHPNYIDNTGFVVNFESSSSTISTTSTCAPNIVLDDGNFYSFFNFEYPSSWSTVSGSIWTATSGMSLVFMGVGPTVSASTLTTIPSTTATMSTASYALRGFAFNIDQNFYTCTVKLCSAASASPTSSGETDGSRYIEAFYSNTINQIRYLPGTTRKSNYNYYSLKAFSNPGLTPSGIGATEDLLTFTPGGFRSQIPNSNFNVLYNVHNSGFSYIQGLSYSSGDSWKGTLVTPWQSINEHSYVSAYGSTMYYQDKDEKWYKISVEAGAELISILEDKIIIINTTSIVNAYDSEKEKFYHYADDYNGRCMQGTTVPTSLPGTIATSSNSTSAFSAIRYTANAINPLYETMPRDPISSMILPIIPRYRCFAGVETVYKNYTNQGDYLDQTVDVFYSEYTETVCKYRISSFDNSRYVKHTLQGLSYPGSTATSATLTPNIFSKFINGAGNNDVVIEGYDAYTLTYYDNQPYLLYSASTQVSNLYSDHNAFFVLQGQFYGVIGNKLYSLVYSNGAVTQMNAIIDLGDIQFIGNNPMISFWYDPATRVIRSFTGDANMETLYSASKIKEYRDSWYDETTQSIYASTDAGLLVFGAKNTYMFENFKNVTNCQFSNDGVTHITDDGITYNLVFYETEGYEPLPLDIETSFYGLGATELTTIDRWNITLYDLEGNHPTSYIKVGTRTINDITVKSEEKEFKITPEMYDKWSNSVLISYSPKLIKGQGIRLYLKTPLIVQSIVPHIMDDGTGTATRRSM